MNNPILVYIPANELIGKPRDEAIFRINRYNPIGYRFDYFTSQGEINNSENPYIEHGYINDILAYTYIHGDGLYLHM